VEKSHESSVLSIVIAQYLDRTRRITPFCLLSGPLDGIPDYAWFWFARVTEALAHPRVHDVVAGLEYHRQVCDSIIDRAPFIPYRRKEMR